MMNIHVRCEWLAPRDRRREGRHFRGVHEEPMSAEALESKFTANCEYRGWSEDRSRRALAVLRALRAAPKVDLAALRG